MMSVRYGWWMAAALCWAVQPALAADKIVPIEEEPRHVLKFQNRHVRYFDVQLPPGYQALWHTHLHDGVFVNIEASETTVQDLGQEPVARAPRIIGETYFIDYTRRPKAHRVGNSGSEPYRVVDTEIHAACGRFAPAQDGEGQTLIVENERVRVTRIMIGPGESLALHPTCGMLVAVTEGELVFHAPGGDEKISMPPAGFKWRDDYAPLRFSNAGGTVFHGVDIVVK